VNKHKGNSCLATRIQVIAGDVKTKNLLTSFNVVLNGMKNLSNQAALPNKIHFSINFPGRYNVQNALAAIGVGLSQKLSLETIARGLAKTQPVPGRSEFIDEGQPFRVLIDFALTPDSLQKLYDEVVTPIAKGKIIALFGSCGDRDRAKRPIMGQIAGKIADLVIITNDEPYHEDPQKIIDEIFAGVLAAGKTEGKNAFRIFDRGEAIDFAFSRARKDDIVVITGMGAETTMVVGDKHIPWNEREIVRAKLKQLVRQQKA
jgi:UDP-N-acetylmuramoyl-L-alanyl-D-glutamate--2,6-diaminopimelate ligase